MGQYDLHVALRVYPGISHTPFIFSDNKLNLVKVSLYSLLESLQDLSFRLTAILDSCPDSFREAIEEVFNGKGKVKILSLQNQGNARTFLKQIEILLAEDDCSVLMLAEDDYLYCPSSLAVLVDFLNKKKADFVTPYDHLDYYTLLIHRNIPVVNELDGIKFRQVNSTCFTFLTIPEVLKRTRRVFESYLRRNSDASIFWALTKDHVLSPGSFFSFILETIKGNSMFLKLFVKAWLHSPAQILFGTRFKLVAPQPSLATHMERSGLAVGVDWHKRATTLINRYGLR